MPTVSDYFDATKQYKEIEIQPGALVVADDISLIQDINNYDRRETAKFLQGFQLKIQALTNAPVLKVKANNDLTEGQVITIEMIDATHAKWKKNSGAWSASIAVTSDDVTWNTLGTSGLDVVFSSTAVAADESEIWVAQGMRLLGGAITAPVANSFTLGVGKWSILGEFEDFTVAKTVAGTSDDDYLYLKVETNEVDYTTDSELGTRLADGEYDPKSIIAHDREYTLMAGAAFPDNTTSPYVEYVIVGKVINAAAGTFTYMWDEPNDIQKIMRIYGDTTAPSTPTGLTLTTGSELGYVTGTIDRAYPQVPINGYLKASCDINSETDVDYYEFKFVRLATPGGAITTDSFTQIVRLNNDAGGMSVPTGVNFTLRNQTFGVPYGVFVRAVDYAGNASSWTARVDEVIGGSTSEISAIAVGPTFTLTDTAGFVGVDVNITALPANCEGFGIWVQEGSYPTTSPGTEWGMYNADVGTVSIPWKESGKPYIRIKGFDQNGIYQTLSSEGNTNLSESAQLAVQGHDDSISSHGGLVGDYLAVTEQFGSLQRAIARIAADGYAVSNVYIVSEGGTYTTIEAALNAIYSDMPSEAVIYIAPGEYISSSTITYPDFRGSLGGALVNVTIVGDSPATSRVKANWDLDTLSAKSGYGGGYLDKESVGLTFKDIYLEGYVEVQSPSGTAHPCLMYDNVVHKFSATNPTLLINCTTVVARFYCKNSQIWSTAALPIDIRNSCDFYFENSDIISGTATQDAIYLTGVTITNFGLFKDCCIQVSGATTGVWIDASVATNVTVLGCYYNTAVGANITRVFGTADTSSQITTDFIL